MAQAVYAQRGPITRRNGVLLLALAVALAVVAGVAANTYVSGEARRVNPPPRTVIVAARDLAPGSVVGRGDVTTTTISVPDAQAAYYLTDANAAELGLLVKPLKQGQPLLAGDVLPAGSAVSVAPLVPAKVKIGNDEKLVAGGLNIPLDLFIAPPPPVRANDHIDLWAQPPGTAAPAGLPFPPGGVGGPPGIPGLPGAPSGPSLPTAPGNAAATTSGATQLVLEDVQIIAFVGPPERPTGYVVAVTAAQLDRFLTFAVQHAPMVVTVRSARGQ